MKQAILTLCVSFFAWSCSSRCVVTPEVTNLRGTILSYSQFNSKIAGEHLLLTTQNGEQLALRGVRVRQDSTLLIQESNGLQCLLPTQDILSIESTNRAIGAIDGFFVGVYSCGVIGYAYGSKTYTSDNMDGLGVANATLLSVAIGGFTGMLLGIGYGHTTTYEITSGQTASKPDSPSIMGATISPGRRINSGSRMGSASRLRPTRQ